MYCRCDLVRFILKKRRNQRHREEKAPAVDFFLGIPWVLASLVAVAFENAADPKRTPLLSAILQEYALRPGTAGHVGGAVAFSGFFYFASRDFVLVPM